MTEKEYHEELGTYLSMVTDIHDRVGHLDKSVEKLHPIAVVRDNVFHVFDYDEKSKEYRFKTKGEIPGIKLPLKILAAFRLPFYDGRACAVITDAELKEPANNVFVFHEFVHCYQLEHGETELKANLAINRQAISKGDMMWEINHPFPYEDEHIVSIIRELYESYADKNRRGIESGYRQLKQLLSDIDYEYLIWQEWKEGYARWVGNKMRSTMGLKKNSDDIESPIDRTAFYELGSRHIGFLENTKGKMNGDIIRLYRYMEEGLTRT